MVFSALCGVYETRHSQLAFKAYQKQQISNPAPKSTLYLGASAEDPLVANIAQLYMTKREEHDKTAAEWTRRFAQG
jgi:hypothetical protein